MSVEYLPSIGLSRNLTDYITKVNEFPMLSIEEEKSLLNSYIKDNNLSAAHKLVTSHLRLVVKIALKYRNYGLPVFDIISEGNIGLMKAIKKFKSCKGTRLSTYAMWWIKANIQDYIIKSWSLVKISASVLQKKLFSSTKKLHDKISLVDNNVPDATIKPISLSDPVGDNGSVIGDFIEDKSFDLEEQQEKKQTTINRKKNLTLALNQLSDREREIIKSRKLIEPPISLKELGHKFSISSERIRQIEESALRKLKNFLNTIQTL